MQPLLNFCFDVPGVTLIYGFSVTEKYVVAPGEKTVVHSLDCPKCKQAAGDTCTSHHAVIETGLIWHAACHPTSNLMLTASREAPSGKIGLWDLEISTHVRDFIGHQSVAKRVVFLSSSTFASASADGVIMLWNSTAEEPTTVLRGHRDHVSVLQKLEKDNLLASGGEDGTVRPWDLATGDCVRVMEGNADGVSFLLFGLNPDTPRLRTGSKGIVRIWDWETRESIATLEDADSRGAGQLLDDSDGSLVTFGVPGKIHTWTQDDVHLGTFAAHDAPVRMLIQLGGRVALTVGSSDGLIKVWDWAGPEGGQKKWLFDLLSGVWLITNAVATGFGKLAITSREKENDKHHTRIWDLEEVRKLALTRIGDAAAGCERPHASRPIT